MPWYWTDDLARTLIDSGKVEPVTVTKWIMRPVAIRSDNDSVEAVAGTLLEDDEDGSSRPGPVALAA